MKTTLRKVILLSVLTVLLGVGVVYVLGYAVKPENSTPTFFTAKGVDEQDGLALTMQLEKTQYVLGEPINITLTVTNISNQSIDFYYGAWTFDFRVYNDTNSTVYQWSSFRVFPQYIVNLPLDAGEGLTRVLIWQQVCNQTSFSEGIPVSPGTYYIVGQIGREYNLQTSPMQITIVKP